MAHESKERRQTLKAFIENTREVYDQVVDLSHLLAARIREIAPVINAGSKDEPGGPLVQTDDEIKALIEAVTAEVEELAEFELIGEKRTANAKQSKVLNAEARDLLSKYPLYTQDGKGGEAVAVLRLFLTGSAATFYVLEGEPAGTNTKGREDWTLYGVSNMGEAEGFRYGYFGLAELEELNLYGGLVHLERDEYFDPTPLKDIAEVVPSLSQYWNNADGGPA